jgi:osmotically inducible lipoprotein OsmB
MLRTNKFLAVFVLLFLLVGCAGMTPGEQRMLSGGAIGAGTGAAIGAITGGSPGVGAAIGGAAGVVGGAILNEMDRGYYGP